MYLADIWMQNKITILTLHKVDKTPGEILAIVDELRFGIEINDLLLQFKCNKFCRSLSFCSHSMNLPSRERGKCDFVTLLPSPKSNENNCQWCTFATAPSSPCASLSNQALSQQRCERKRTSSSFEHKSRTYFLLVFNIHVGLKEIKPTCHFCGLEDGRFCWKWIFSDPKTFSKRNFWWPNQSSKTTFIVQNVLYICFYFMNVSPFGEDLVWI